MQMTREESNRHYDDCIEDGGGRAGKVFVCLLAIHSGNYRGTELANLYFMKGIHQQNGGEYGKSISDFSKALKINPDDAEADTTAFRKLKKVRDDLLHALDAPATLPTEDIQRLLMKYLKPHLDVGD